MALYTKKEFAKMCCMSTRQLAVNIGRMKVIVNATGLIDSDNVLNGYFLLISKDRVRKNSF